LYKNKWIIITTASLATFAIGLSTSAVNMANPTLARFFEIGIEQVQWVTTIFTLVVIALMLLFGRLGDQSGNNRVFNIGVLIFNIGSLCCGMSGSFAVLLIGRAIQAVGAAMIMASSMAIAAEAFPVSERGRAMGITVLSVGLGRMCGPSLGGLVLSYFEWNFIFYTILPFGIAAFVLGAIFLRPEAASNKVRLSSLDLIGAFFLAVITSSVILFLSGGFRGSRWFGLLFIAAIPVFVIYEKRHREPLWNFELLRNPRFSLGNLMAFMMYSSQTAVVFLLPFYMTDILELPIGTMSMMLMITPLCMAVFSPISGVVSDRIGAMRLLPLSFLILLAAFTCLFFLSDTSSLWHIAIGAGLIGAGYAFCAAPNNSEIMTAAGRELSGYAGGFVSTTRNLGFCIATAASAGSFSSLLRIFSGRYDYITAYLSALRCVIAAAAFTAVIGIYICLKMKRAQTADKSV